jgi:hypothetical protein
LAPTALLAGDLLGFFGARGHDGTSFPGTSQGGLSVTASENFTLTAKGSSVEVWTTPIGTATRVQTMQWTSTIITATIPIRLGLPGALTTGHCSRRFTVLRRRTSVSTILSVAIANSYIQVLLIPA